MEFHANYSKYENTNTTKLLISHTVADKIGVDAGDYVKLNFKDFIPIRQNSTENTLIKNTMVGRAQVRAILNSIAGVPYTQINDENNIPTVFMPMDEFSQILHNYVEMLNYTEWMGRFLEHYPSYDNVVKH